MSFPRPVLAALAVTVLLAPADSCPKAGGARHNVILFVPDGLRALKVDATSAPAMAALRDRGVNFSNSHSLYPTVTTANASAMATGHAFGDTGDFANTLFAGFPSPAAAGSVAPFLENDAVLGDLDEHFGGNYLHEETLLEAARAAGVSTAVIGKLGPALVFDHRDRTGAMTILVDDSTGNPGGIPVSPEVQDALRAAGLPLQAPTRGDNGRTGTSTSPGTLVPNAAQQDYFVNVATKVVLPLLKARARPFLMVFWSRDPDGTQHNQGDSLNQLTPGINGPTSLAAIRNADEDLARIEEAVAGLGLAATTDIVVSADHGFATISKQSETSPSARVDYSTVPHGFLPPGFLTLDLANALGLPAFDPDNGNAPIGAAAYSRRSNGLLGRDPNHPDVVVAANGGSDLIYLPSRDKNLAGRVIAALLAQDYTSGVFVDDRIGSFAGTLPLSTIGLAGAAVMPRPSIVVSFRSESTGCEQPLLCTAEVTDATFQQGQGYHGSFSRADTMNFMAATGPDFKSGFVDDAPVSNADVGQTLARILGLTLHPKGRLVGRVLVEALIGGAVPGHKADTIRSTPAAGGLRTIVRYQQVDRYRYFDAAGFPGRTVGLEGDGSVFHRSGGFGDRSR